MTLACTKAVEKERVGNLLLEMSRMADMRFSYKEQINMEMLGNMFNIFSPVGKSLFNSFYSTKRKGK